MLINTKTFMASMTNAVRAFVNAFNAVVFGKVVITTKTTYVPMAEFHEHKVVSSLIKVLKSTKKSVEDKTLAIRTYANKAYDADDLGLFGPLLIKYFDVLPCTDEQRISDLLEALKSPTPVSNAKGEVLIRFRDAYETLTFRLKDSKDITKFPYKLAITNMAIVEKLRRAVDETYCANVYEKNEAPFLPFEDLSELEGVECQLFNKEFLRANGTKGTEWWVTDPSNNLTANESEWLKNNVGKKRK